MPISHVSQRPFAADPYVLPMDLNLMGKVLSIKQAKFDENAKNLQTGVNRLGALDILHPTKKDYANQKVSELVNNINNFGGVDLSDANVSNQIENLGTSIYNDDNIIEGLSSTASIRKLQDFYSKAKTDPKLNKLYAPQNEWHDMNPVNQYLSNKDLSAQYQGGSSPTPYVPFKDQLFKNIEGVKANLRQTISSNGTLMFLDQQNREVSPDRIVQMARDLTTPEQSKQMDIDADFQFRSANPNEVLNRAASIHQTKVTESAAKLQRYKEMLINSTNDPLARQNYEYLVKEQQEELNTLSKVSANDFINKYKQNPQQFNRGLYADEFYRGVGSRFSYSENTRKLTPNFAEMFNLKMAQAERFHNDNIQLEMAKSANRGSSKVKRDSDGNLVPDDSANFTLTNRPPNTDDPNAAYTGEKAFTTRVDELSKENTKLVQDFISKFANDNEDVKRLIESSESGSGISVILQGQKLLEGNNGVPGFQMDDLKITSDNYTGLVQQGLTDEQLKVFSKLYDAYDQLSTGQDKGIKKFPKGLKNAVEQLQLNNEAILANKDKISAINTQLASEFGISSEDAALLAQAKKLGMDNKDFQDVYYTALGINKGIGIAPAQALRRIENMLGTSANNPETAAFLNDKTKMDRISAIQDKINSSEYERRAKALYDQPMNRPVYSRPIITEGYFGKKSIDDVKNLAASILHSKGDVSGDMMDASPSDITIIDAGKSFGVTPYTMTVAVKSGDGKSTTYKNLPLDPTSAREMGFVEGPYDKLNDIVVLRGKSSPLIIGASINPNIEGRQQALSAKIVLRHDFPGDRNNSTTTAYIVDANGNKISDIPRTTAQTPAQAYAAAKAFIQNAENAGMDFKQMLDKIIADSYKEQD